MILYGLIALVALSAVAALIYFHVLDLGRYLPDTCDIGGTGDLKCEEIRVSSNGNIIEFGIRNVAQKNIADLKLMLNETANIHLATLAEGNFTGSIAPGEIVKVTILLNDTTAGLSSDGVTLINKGRIKQGNTFEARIFTSYRYSDGAITQEASGSMKVKAS